MQPQQPSDRLSPLKASQQVNYNSRRIESEREFRPRAVDTNLAKNPFLKGEEKFQFLLFNLNDFNGRVKEGQVTDPYEAMFYERLHRLACDLAYIETKEAQLIRLDEVLKWMKEQQKLVSQRRDQGYVRYEVLKGPQPESPPKTASENVS